LIRNIKSKRKRSNKADFVRSDIFCTGVGMTKGVFRGRESFYGFISSMYEEVCSRERRKGNTFFYFICSNGPFSRKSASGEVFLSRGCFILSSSRGYFFL
jgi:hypothetical protein